jgi:hypothetical protein
MLREAIDGETPSASYASRSRHHLLRRRVDWKLGLAGGAHDYRIRMTDGTGQIA